MLFVSKNRRHPKADEPKVYSPYLDARHEWDERYGDFITRARNWRFVALLCALIALVATGGLVWLASRSHVIPFVVAIDNLGRPIASGTAEQASAADDRLKRASILSWVENLRTVTSDTVTQRKMIDHVYIQIANGSHAQAFVSDFYRGNPPQKRAETETVAVEVSSVLPTSDRTYEVEWKETTRDLYGTVKSTDRWKGSFTIALDPPTDERLARVNPLGIYVIQASWAKIL